LCKCRVFLVVIFIVRMIFPTTVSLPKVTEKMRVVPLLTRGLLIEKGNSALVAITVLNMFLYVAVKQYYIWRNKSKERQWQQLSAEEKAVYLETTTVEGNKRLDFRFVH